MKNTTQPDPFILIAEDEPDTARLIEFHMLRQGYRTEIAPVGLTALNDIVNARPDLIILDLMLPQLDGLELCRLVKSSPLIRQMRVLILTAMATPEDKIKGLELGADDYMTKPFDIPTLLVRVKSLLEQAGPRQVRQNPLAECRTDDNDVLSTPV